jgi:hypothetical protein
MSLAVGVLLTSIGYSSAVIAQQDPQKETTTQTGETSKTAPIGFPTGTKCTKTGTYKAENKFLRIVLVVAEGEEFPLFADGQKTIWYALAPSSKTTFDAVKVTTSDPN